MDENNSTYYRRDTTDRTFVGALNSQRRTEQNIAQLETQIRSMQQAMSSYVNTMKEAEALGSKLSTKYDNILTKINIANEAVSRGEKENQKDINKRIELAEQLNKLRLDAAKAEYELKSKYIGLDEKEKQQMEEYLAYLQDETGDVREQLRSIEKDADNAANKWKYLKSSFRELKTDLKDLTMITGLDKIGEELRGTSKNSWMSVRSAAQLSLGASNSEWNSFKNKLLTNTMSMNMSLGKAYFNSEDIKTYVSNLSELGIYDTKMAESQLKAVLEGNKILGMSVETQSSILKIARRTNNDELLNDVNNTVSTLMNMEIGISKEQLNQLTKQSVAVADTLSIYGNPNAATQLQKASTYIEKTYGQGMGNAAGNILSDLLTKGVSSQYYTALGGADDIINLARTDAGKALVALVNKARTSGYVRTAASSPYAMEALSPGSDLLSLYSASSTGQSYEDFLSKYNASNTTASSLGNKLYVSIGDSIKNAVSLIGSLLPDDALLSLQKTFYLASLAYYAANAIGGIQKFLMSNALSKSLFGKSSLELIKTMFNDTLLQPMASSSIGSGILNILPIAAAAFGAILAIKDGVTAINKYKSGQWNNSEHSALSAAIGGFLGGTSDDTGSRVMGNTVKFAAIGAGIGKYVGHPLIGALIGGGVGLLLGLAGGESISSGIQGGIESFTSLFNGESNTGSASGIGSAGSYPYGKTSSFGWRTLRGGRDYHDGIDFAFPEGTPIGSNTSGVVYKVGTDQWGGNYVRIKDGNDLVHDYWHLMQPSHLQVGEMVRAGQFIGYSGNTGNSTGPHLHYGISSYPYKFANLSTGDLGNHFDPEPYITGNLFYPTEYGEDLNLVTKEDEENQELNGNNIITPTRRLASSSTLQASNVYSSYAMGNPGSGNKDVIYAINTGFNSLISKIDELSDRQDNTEEMLKAITLPSSPSIYKY